MMNDMSRKELLALPERKWDDTEKTYESIMLLSTRKKHDSGWAMIHIIGVNERKPCELVLSCADDLEWKTPFPMIHELGKMRMDCCFRTGAMHFWGRGIRFKVGMAISSVDIEVLQTHG